MKRILILLLLALPLFAKDAKAPLPKKLLDAKTVFLVNAGSYDPRIHSDVDVFDQFYAEMQKGKLRVVNSREAADVVITVSYNSVPAGTEVDSYHINNQLYVDSSIQRDPILTMTVLDKDNSLLWQASRKRKLASLQKNREKNLRESVAELVADFNSRLN